MEPLRVSVRRGDVVEAVHRVHAVAVQDGEVVAEAGDRALVAFMRCRRSRSRVRAQTSTSVTWRSRPPRIWRTLRSSPQ